MICALFMKCSKIYDLWNKSMMRDVNNGNFFTNKKYEKILFEFVLKLICLNKFYIFGNYYILNIDFQTFKFIIK